MKALTIQQPYASLIAAGTKWVENRTWSTQYRGPLAIHAGKGTDYISRAELDKYPTGVVVAIASLVYVGPKIGIDYLGKSAPEKDRASKPKGCPWTWRELASHEHTRGPVCWVLSNAVKLDAPIEWKGKQRLWEFPINALGDHDRIEVEASPCMITRNE